MDYTSSGLDIENERRYPTPYATSPLLPLLLLSLCTQKHTPKIKSRFRKEYDYVIVGAGSAGSVVASRLSEIPCVSVLLLEAGRPPPRLTDIPAITKDFSCTDIDWNYRTTPQRYTAAGHTNRMVPWSSGKTIGGSSVFDCMSYVRGNRRNYDEWAELGAKGWSYEEVLPYFMKLEDNTDPDFLQNGFHCAGGPITASRPAFHSRKKRALMEAVLNEGFNFVDPNADEQVGYYDYQSTTRKGQRCSAAKAYLVPGENRTNLDIIANAMVTKVLINNNKRAVGVEFDFRGKAHRVRARKEVILSAGTTNTPQLLMLSGIGPMSELKKFNIPLVEDLAVGKNFQDHPASLLVYKLDNRLPTFIEELNNEKNIKDYIHRKIGPLTSSEGLQLMSFSSNDGLRDVPDYTLYFADTEATVPKQLGLTAEVFSNIFMPLANQSFIMCFSQLLHPRSIGTVSLQSANPYDPPLIDPNFLDHFGDVHDMVKGLEECHRIMENPAMKRIHARPIEQLVPGCEEFAENRNLYFRCIVRTIIMTTYHQVGTAKMGDPKDPTTVVDPELRVKGIRRLRVVDASVMPTVPWGNTNIPTIMVAEKASDIIKQTIRCGACG